MSEKTFSVVTIVHDNLDGGEHVTNLYIGCSGPALDCCTWLMRRSWVKAAELTRVRPGDLPHRDDDEVSRSARIMRLYGDWRSTVAAYDLMP